jgi:hypothetical protein
MRLAALLREYRIARISMSFVVRPYQLGWNLNLRVTYHDKQRHQWTLHSNASELETKLADLRIAERELLASRKFPVRKDAKLRRGQSQNASRRQATSAPLNDGTADDPGGRTLEELIGLLLLRIMRDSQP